MVIGPRSTEDLQSEYMRLLSLYTEIGVQLVAITNILSERGESPLTTSDIPAGILTVRLRTDDL